MLDLADTLQISAAVGLVLGGFAGLFKEAGSTADVADNVASGCTHGAFLGTVFGMSLWICVTLKGGTA